MSLRYAIARPYTSVAVLWDGSNTSDVDELIATFTNGKPWSYRVDDDGVLTLAGEVVSAVVQPNTYLLSQSLGYSVSGMSVADFQAAFTEVPGQPPLAYVVTSTE